MLSYMTVGYHFIRVGMHKAISWQKQKHPTAAGEREYEETRNNPYIIHFSGHVKPWSKDFEGPTKKYYEKYAGMTAFRCVAKFLNIQNMQKFNQNRCSC